MPMSDEDEPTRESHGDRMFRGAITIVLAGGTWFALALMLRKVSIPNPWTLSVVILIAGAVGSYIVGYLTGDFRHDISNWRQNESQ